MYGDYGIFGMSAAVTAALISAAGTGIGVAGKGIVSKKERALQEKALAYQRQTQFYADQEKARRQKQLIAWGVPIAALLVIGLVASRSRA